MIPINNYLPWLQLAAVKPERHVQWYELIRSSHTPLWRHGLLTQLLMSGKYNFRLRYFTCARVHNSTCAWLSMIIFFFISALIKFHNTINDELNTLLTVGAIEAGKTFTEIRIVLKITCSIVETRNAQTLVENWEININLRSRLLLFLIRTVKDNIIYLQTSIDTHVLL